MERYVGLLLCQAVQAMCMRLGGEALGPGEMYAC